ncbi:alpha/beta hydrolase-fold protein [Aeoliella mucimassa]|uniref:Esterase n=1 Tax=Aeoliella mucimassa TaxID=2527972 RepID=A0A518AWB3_9BACT|nr:alpha/beta hydrolase-fold protein [Aeoliella mucimassa]QDU59008.1 Putative esterase [Aeoliella mucimassa]
MIQQSNPTGAWEVVEVAGHAVDLFEPQVPNKHGYVAIYLHSVGGECLADDSVFTAEFARHGLRVVAPRGDESWWSNRIYPAFDSERTAEAYVVEDLMQYIHQRWDIESPRVGLLGVSMGGQGALRIAYKYSRRFPVVAAVAPAIDFHQWIDSPPAQGEVAHALRQLYRDPEDARQDTATLHVHPLAWPPFQYFCSDPLDHWHEGADRLQMKLASLGIPHECDLVTSHGGHGWDYFHAMAPTAVEFVANRLEKERCRIV